MRPGDVMLAHASGTLSSLIAVGERLRLRHLHTGLGWLPTHAGIITDADGSTIEATSAGVVRSSVAAHQRWTYLPCPEGVDRAKVVTCAASMLGWRYDWHDLVDLGVDCLTGAHLHDVAAHQVICSELAALSLVAGGWHCPKAPGEVMPSDLFEWLSPELAPV
jgi:hypothetical protein